MNKQKLTEARDTNRAAEVGSQCICPWCGGEFTKRNFTQYACHNDHGQRVRDVLRTYKGGAGGYNAGGPVNVHPFVYPARWNNQGVMF